MQLRTRAPVEAILLEELHSLLGLLLPGLPFAVEDRAFGGTRAPEGRLASLGSQRPRMVTLLARDGLDPDALFSLIDAEIGGFVACRDQGLPVRFGLGSASIVKDVALTPLAGLHHAAKPRERISQRLRALGDALCIDSETANSETAIGTTSPP